MAIVLNGKTYNAVGFNNNQQMAYLENSGGVPASFSWLTAKVGYGSGKSPTTVKWNLSLPIVALTDSDCACAGDVLRVYRVKIELEEPAGSTAAERADVLARLAALTGKPEFTGSVTGPTQPSA